MELEENEKIEDLQFKNLKIIQNKKWFCFGMDSVLISNFSKNIKNRKYSCRLRFRNWHYFGFIIGKNKCKKNNLC